MAGMRPGAWGRRAASRGLLLVSLAVVLVLAGCAHSRAQTWTGRVVHVHDGDSIYVRAPGRAHAVAVRLQGLDAPELCQAGGVQSRQALQDLLEHQEVTVIERGHDAYGRTLARVRLRGQDVGRLLVAQGHAWSYRVGQDPGPYMAEQRQARAARLGLFAQARPELPRAFRQRHGPCHAP